MIEPALALKAITSLETYLNPLLFGQEQAKAEIGQGLKSGKLVVIENAFQRSFAERMFTCLSEFPDWKLYESYDPSLQHGTARDLLFHYRHRNIYESRVFPRELMICKEIFSSEATTQLVQHLSGELCRGTTAFSASWYQPGDHSFPHTDALNDAPNVVRKVAFVWHLSKNWRPEWGGAFYWCPAQHYVVPQFNSLVLFVVGGRSSHFVTQVSPAAQTKRLAINGWWRDTESSNSAAADVGSPKNGISPGIQII